MTIHPAEFTIQSAAVRARFGAGLRRSVPKELESLGIMRALIVTGPRQAALAAEMAEHCGPRCAGTFTEAAMHTPVAVSEQASELARALDADGIVALGGGSAIGLGKAIALRTGLAQIVLPTTYSGSECTAILGQTENGVKTTLVDPKVQPGVILYDADLVTELPPELTATSSLNAMAHAAEALYARDRSPLSSLMAMEGLRAFKTALPVVMAEPGNREARGKTLYGAWLCGTVLGQVGMSLHHKLCHTLGGSFDLPHSDTHAIMLPHSIAFNARAVPDLLAPVTEVFGGADAGTGLWQFAKQVGAPLALRDLGVTAENLDRAADLAVANPYWNPREVSREGVRALLQNAWEGTPPAA